MVELVLDLSIRSAVGYVWERLTKLLDRHPVSLVAWSPVIGARRPGSAERRHASTLAAYRLLDALRERYPEMVLVSTALDAAMARRAVVADGLADSGRRHAEFGSLVQVLPPERLWQPAYDEPEDGSAPGYRAVAAFFGAWGWVSTCVGRRRPACGRSTAGWVSTRSLRPLLHGGRTVRLDIDEPGFAAHGVVSAQRDEALFALVWLDRSPARVRLRGSGPGGDLSARGRRSSAGRPAGGDPGLAGRRPGPPADRTGVGHGGDHAAAGPAGVGAVAAPDRRSEPRTSGPDVFATGSTSTQGQRGRASSARFAACSAAAAQRRSSV